MKKFLFLTFSVILIIGCLTGCNPESKENEMNKSSSDTSDTFETSYTAFLQNDYEDVKVLTSWHPVLSEGWYFYPEYEKEDSQNFAFEITIENSEIVDIEDTEFAHLKDNELFAPENGVLFELMPQTLTCKITNQTGEDFFQLGSAYLECYKADALSGIGGWVRVPYVNEDDNAKGKIFYENGEGTYTLNINKYKKSAREDVAYRYFEAGFYRVVFYLNDGPHYVRFMILYTPE